MRYLVSQSIICSEELVSSGYNMPAQIDIDIMTVVRYVEADSPEEAMWIFNNAIKEAVYGRKKIYPMACIPAHEVKVLHQEKRPKLSRYKRLIAWAKTL